MLLTLSTTHRPATDLGYLLAKNPAKVQSFELAFGKAHVFYPEATEDRCTVALLLDVDPVRLTRREAPGGSPLEPYVNDRPYVASSFLSVAIAQVLASALGGRSSDRPELAGTAIPLVATLESVPCRGGRSLLDALFAPLGYTFEAERLDLDDHFPSWGPSPYYRLRLSGEVRLATLLSHLYVLIPVLDDEKHYWVGDDEVEKLLRHGEGWLASHPERETIAARYLKRRRNLVRRVLDRLDEGIVQEEVDEEADAAEQVVETPVRLGETRLNAVRDAVVALGASTVLDLGCGEGKLLRLLMREKPLSRIVGVDVSLRALDIARSRLSLDELPTRQKDRIALLQGSLTYRDRRFSGFDVATLVEVIEHIDPSRLAALERVVFQYARPRAVVVTTPNAEYNALFEGLPAGRFRHADHRFEWTRADFTAWAERVAAGGGYSVRFEAVGPIHEVHGAPTQMAIFVLGGAAS